MLSSLFRGIIFVLLILMLLMCAVFFWGAYNNHRVTLHAIQNEINSILKDVAGKDANVVDTRMGSLKNIQKDLFETNTITFFFNLFMIIIVTVGGYILSNMLRNQKDAETMLISLQKCLSDFIGSLRFEFHLQSSLYVLRGLSMSIGRNNAADILVEIRDALKQINGDCSLMPISRIGLSPESCKRLIGSVQDVKTRLRAEQDTVIVAELDKLRTFLTDNEKRFKRYWERSLGQLEIESIDIRESSLHS